jgi:hypothetical protein
MYFIKASLRSALFVSAGNTATLILGLISVDYASKEGLQRESSQAVSAESSPIHSSHSNLTKHLTVTSALTYSFFYFILDRHPSWPRAVYAHQLRWVALGFYQLWRARLRQWHPSLHFLYSTSRILGLVAGRPDCRYDVHH